MKIDHFIRIYLDCDFSHLPKDESWVRNRIEFFERFTLKSLESQTFKDFEIILLCGRQFKHITSAHRWPDGIRISYNYGRDVFQKSAADYIAITRIDSDDLYHRDAMANIRGNLKVNPQRRECLIFRHAQTWDMINKLLTPRHRPSPPFYTHIYPRVIFMDWPRFKADHFIGHGRAGGRLLDTTELPEGRVIVTNSDWNVGYFRRQIAPVRMTEGTRAKYLKQFPQATGDKKTINKTLEEFGIKNGWEAYPWTKKQK